MLNANPSMPYAWPSAACPAMTSTTSPKACTAAGVASLRTAGVADRLRAMTPRRRALAATCRQQARTWTRTQGSHGVQCGFCCRRARTAHSLTTTPARH